MSDEIKVSYISGLSDMAVNVFKPDGSDRDLDISLTENGSGGVYLGDCAAIVSGDLINAYHVGVYLGSEIYVPDGDPARILNLIEADKVIDTSGTPWVLEYRNKTTKAVLLRQELKDTGGSDISSTAVTLGRKVLE